MRTGLFKQYTRILRRLAKAGLKLWVLCLLTACDSGTDAKVVNLEDVVSEEELLVHKQQQEQEPGTLYFGFDLRSSPQEDSRQYLPFLRYLEEATGFRFELRFTPANSSIIDELGTGAVHLAALGAVSYIHGREKYGITNLVRGLNQENRAQYQSMIVVNPASSIKSVSDLVNKRFAFGDIESTQGHLIPRIVLQVHGIAFDKLAFHEYTGSHKNCAEAVISFKFDACGMQDTMAKEMENQHLLKILYVSKYYPSSGIAANQSLSSSTIEKVKRALIDFNPQGKYKDKLYHWSQTEMPNGFVAAEESDYQDMRKWLLKFDMLKLASRQDSKK